MSYMKCGNCESWERCAECGWCVFCAESEKAKLLNKIERLREAELILKELLETVKRAPLKSFADLLSDEWINIVRQTERFLGEDG